MSWNFGQPPNWYRRAQWKAAWSKRNGVHYVGDDVVIDTTWPTAAYEGTMRHTETFDAGTEGAVIGTSRPTYTTPTVHGSPTYSATHAYGGMAMKAGADTDYIEYAGLSSKNDQYGRIYFYATALPASGFPFIWQGQKFSIRIGSSDGRVYSPAGNSTQAITLNQWMRFEAHLQSGVGMTLKIFNGDSVTPTETLGPAAMTAQESLYRIGCSPPFGSWGSDIWYDNICVNADSWPGPYIANEATVTAIDYEVRDYFGKIISQGQFDERQSWFVVTPPGGGWKPGWYRLYLTGPQTATNYENSYGATNFCVVKSDAHFPVMPAGNTGGGAHNDMVMKGVMGQTSRLAIGNAADPDSELLEGSLAQAAAEAQLTADYWSDNGIADSERPARIPWCAFPGGTFDRIFWAGATVGQNWAKFYPLDGTKDGDNLYITVSSGTNANTDKVRIYYPDSTTLVETFDNLASNTAAKTTINASSNYVRVFISDCASSRAAYSGPTAIGWAHRNGVVEVVQTLYPLGVTRFEGPINEPSLTDESAHWMRLHQKAVHDGDANAKALGPCVVSLDQNWAAFNTNNGFSYCDEISVHAYNAVTNGCLPLGRYTLPNFLATLDSYGQSEKTLWQTESTNVFTAVYGIYHPRRARKCLLETLLLEQYGIPRERNNWWYDVSMGFWDYPSFLQAGDGGLEPHMVMGRVLAEETWGKPFFQALDFGTYGNMIYLGSVYKNAAGESTVALMATCYMTGASIVLAIAGTSADITVVDGFGHENVMPQSKGRITIPMTDIPAYVRLPAGATASVYRINGWCPLGVGASVTPSATTKTIDGVSYPVIADDGWLTSYGDQTGIAPSGVATVPSDTTLVWDTAKTVERIMVWAGICWQPWGTLTDFDVQTYDGADWVTRKTVTKPDMPWFDFGTDSFGANCFIETYWDEQWVFDVELDSPISCLGVRLNVRAASYGGEPLPDTDIAGGGGQGNNVQGYRVMEIAAMDTNRYAGVAA